MKKISVAAFVLVGLFLLYFFCGQVSPSSFVQDSLTSQKNIRENPVSITPIATEQYVTFPTENTEEIIKLMIFPNDSRMPCISYMLHYLQFWGGINSSLNNGVSEEDMISFMLDDKKYPWLPVSDPVLYNSGDNILRISKIVSFPYTRGTEGEVHVGQVLASLGAVGVPTTRSVICANKSYKVKDLVKGSLSTFTLDGELEFQLMACLYYLPPTGQWENRWGDCFSFDSIAEHLLKRAHGRGMCAGTHQLILFAAMLRVNEKHNILRKETIQKIEKYITEASQLLEKNQTDKGSWTFAWFDRTGKLQKNKKSTSDLHITGHHLEWIIISPPKLRPSKETVAKALTWTQDALSKVSSDDVRNEICEHMHAIKALVQVICAQKVKKND